MIACDYKQVTYEELVREPGVGPQVNLPELYRCVRAQVLFAILLAALGIAQAQMSFPDITQAAAAIERVFGTIDRKTTIDSSSDAGALLQFCVSSGCAWALLTAHAWAL